VFRATRRDIRMRCPECGAELNVAFHRYGVLWGEPVEYYSVACCRCKYVDEYAVPLKASKEFKRRGKDLAC
jgi:C4-type Zn-finger protein